MSYDDHNAFNYETGVFCHMGRRGANKPRNSGV